MKKRLYILISMLLVAVLFSSCKKETGFKIEGTPYMEVSQVIHHTVEYTNDAGKKVKKDSISFEPVLVSIEDGKQFSVDLFPNQYAVSASKKGVVPAVLKAEEFQVRSNLKWRIVPAEENGYDWIKVSPDTGEKDGKFIFTTGRNLALESREAYFTIQADLGNGYEDLPALLLMKQKKQSEIFECSDLNFSIESGSKTLKPRIISNVEWTYTIEPMSDYATENCDWITDNTNHEPSKMLDTLSLKVAANNGSIRGATVIFKYKLDGVEQKTELPITQYGASAESVDGFPVGWIIGTGTDKINFNTTFPTAGYIEASTGSGRISYYSDPDKNDPSGNFAMLVGSGGDPYVTGAWIGDYWEFKSSEPVSAGAILKISFQAATSAKGPKYWRLEYRDGDEWLVPSSLKNSFDDNGKEVVYTHTMLSGSSKTVDVSAVVKLKNTTDAADFRFVCAHSLTSDGTASTAPRGGTMRLTLADPNDAKWQPTIDCLAAGTEVVKKATISVTGADNNLLTFEGVPEADQQIVINSSLDFQLTTDMDWIKFDKDSGDAEQNVAVKISCDPNSNSTLRKGQIDIKSGVSHYYITVVQSAAGGDLDPLISISDGNKKTVSGKGEEFTVKVQANVDFQTEISDSWITAVPVVSTKAMVESKTLKFKAEANASDDARTATIRFYKDNIESVLTVTQDKFTPEIKITVDGDAELIPAEGSEITATIESNVDFKAKATGITLPLPETIPAGTYPGVKISIPANDGGLRNIKVVLTAVGATYSKELSMAQLGKNMTALFTEDFSWLDPLIKAWNDTSKTPVGDPVEGFYKDGSKTDVNYDSKTGASSTDLTQNVSTAPFDQIPGLLKDKGYEDMNAGKKAIYPQKSYLKFGRSSVQTALKLPALKDLAESSDAVVEFDWCAHISSKGDIDDVKLAVGIIGNGTFADGNKYSKDLVTAQKKGQMFWNHVKLLVKGIDKDTRLVIFYSPCLNKNTGAYNFAVKKAHRYHIDNIKISK